MVGASPAINGTGGFVAAISSSLDSLHFICSIPLTPFGVLSFNAH
jgi:hypothetical protein